MLLFAFRDLWKEMGRLQFSDYRTASSTPQVAEVIGTLNCCAYIYIYHSGILNNTVCFWTLRMTYYFVSPFICVCLCTFSLFFASTSMLCDYVIDGFV